MHVLGVYETRSKTEAEPLGNVWPKTADISQTDLFVHNVLAWKYLRHYNITYLGI